MNLRRLFPLLLLLPAVLRAQTETDVFDVNRTPNALTSRLERTPTLDPKRLINESSSFLKEREPEMTAEEYALYEKMVGMLSANPTLALRLLENMVKAGEKPSPAFAYIQALSGDPGNADWQEGLLRLCVEGGQLVRAERIARVLIKNHPAEARFWFTLANILLSANRRLEAVAVLELAAGTGIATPDELVLLGDLYAEQGLNPEALAIYTKLLKPVPETGEQKLLRLAQTLIAAGRGAEAEKALAALPANPTPAGRTARLMARAQIASGAKRWAEARRDLEEVLADAPMNGAALLALGEVHVGEGDDTGAALVFESATRVPAAAYRASLELANLELRNRHYARTVEHLQRALSLERSEAVEDYLGRVKVLVNEETPRDP